MKKLKFAAWAIVLVALASCGNNKSSKRDNTLTNKEINDGWTLLFDGVNPAGWRSFNGNYFPNGWRVDNGTLKSNGVAQGDIGGDIVYSPETYSNFHLKFEWKISKGGNSGVMYHVQEGPRYQAPWQTGPEYQVIDDMGFAEPLEEWQKVGADYAMYLPALDRPIKPAGEWNTSEIIFTPKKVEYFLNGKRTVSFVPWSADWEKLKNSGKWKDAPDYGKFNAGLIALQDHGSEVWYKNIKIKKL